MWWEVILGHPIWTLSSAMTPSQTAGWTRVAWCIAVATLVWLPFDPWPSQLGSNKRTWTQRRFFFVVSSSFPTFILQVQRSAAHRRQHQRRESLLGGWMWRASSLARGRLHGHGCRDKKELQSCAEKQGRWLDRISCHRHEETTALLLLDHNEDSEPFPRGLWEKTCHFCFRLFCYVCRHCFFVLLFSFMPLIVFNT